jgi:drug/metabolite transporter (DMT)-like permease
VTPETATPDLARRERVAMTMLITAIVIWACTPRVTAEASPHTQPLTLTMLRAAPAAVALVLAYPLLRYKMPPRAAWVAVLVSGVLMVPVFLLGFTEGVIRAGPGNASVLGSTAPFFIAAAGWFGYSERPTKRTMLGIVVGFVGVVLIVSTQLDTKAGGRDMAIGLTAALAAAAAWSVGTIVLRQMFIAHPDVDPIGLTTVQYVVGGAVLVAVSLAVDGASATEWGSIGLWLPVIFVSVIGSGLATVIYVGAFRTIAPIRAAPYTFLSPVVSVLLEIVLGHPPKPIVAFGMALTLVGVGIVTLKAWPLATRRRLTTS